MTRHSRNSTAGTCYTYHEKKKDTSQSGYGSKEARLGKDSIKDFDCCSLTLQPCRNPVVTSDGYLYDKESVLEYIIHQKREIARQLKEFEKQKQRNKDDLEDLKRVEQETKVKTFLEKESGLSKNTSAIYSSTSKQESTASTSKESISNMGEGKEKKLPSFWLPCETPQAKESSVKKPDEKVRCPISGKPLKLKDLIPVKFTPIKDGDSKTSLIAKSVRYVCPVTNDVLGNSVPCAVLRTSGSVVTMECVEKLIMKDMLDPINGQKLRDKDIIPLQRGATGFSGSGIQLEAKKHGPAMMS